MPDKLHALHETASDALDVEAALESAQAGQAAMAALSTPRAAGREKTAKKKTSLISSLVPGSRSRRSQQAQ